MLPSVCVSGPSHLTVESTSLFCLRIILSAALLRYLHFEYNLQKDSHSFRNNLIGRAFNGYDKIGSCCSESICESLEDAGLYSKALPDLSKLKYLTVADDTGYALLGVRLYLERRLRMLANLNKTGAGARGIEEILASLKLAKVLDVKQVKALLQLNTELNKAAHGKPLINESGLKRWVVNCSPRFFSRLDELVADSHRAA